LPEIDKIRQLSHLLHTFGELCLAIVAEFGLELILVVEVILDGAFIGATNDDDVGNAGRDGLFDNILNNRLVDDRQHLLGHSFGHGQETRTETGGADNCFGNFFGHTVIS